MRFILILLLLISTLWADDNSVRIKAAKVGKYIIVSGENKNPFSVTVTYKADFKNLSMDVKMPMLFVMKPQSKAEVLKLHIDKNDFAFKAHYEWTLSNRGGASRAFEKDANHVIIEHSDGTLASYDHLKQNGVVVKVGQKIQRGQLIGYSGKTGYAQGPHLHFIVYKAIDGTHRESLPVKFMGRDGIIETPKKGVFYQAGR